MVGASRTSPVPGSGMRRRHERRRTLPRFGALLGDNTPSPSLRGLRMITKALVSTMVLLELYARGRRRQGLLSSPPRCESNSNRFQPFAWVPWGVYIGLPPRGIMVIWPGVGPDCQCLWWPASPPAAGARRLVGPADWSGTEPTGRRRRSRVLSAADLCSCDTNDTGLVRGSWLQLRPLAGDYCSHSASRLVNGAWVPRKGRADCWGRPSSGPTGEALAVFRALADR